MITFMSFGGYIKPSVLGAKILLSLQDLVSHHRGRPLRGATQKDKVMCVFNNVFATGYCV